jgi:hypothetical protein
MWEQELEALRGWRRPPASVRRRRAAAPRLLPVRRPFSMPGMMDTILNIGLNDEVAAG